MKEHNRLRIERLTTRYAKHAAAGLAADEAEFERAFRATAESVIRPLMEDVASELRKAGHAARIVLDEAPAGTPSIELALGLTGAKGTRNVVGFAVIRWEGYPIQILAYLEVSPPKFDLDRFATPAAVTAERVEQILVDAAEHVLVCNER